jgi:hypothetical protein
MSPDQVKTMAQSVPARVLGLDLSFPYQSNVSAMKRVSQSAAAIRTQTSNASDHAE